MQTGELIRLCHRGNREARSRLVEENTGLIWAVAKRYFGRGVDGEDLFQLGCVGFLKAVDGFDPDYGTQFSTYAVPKIAGEIRRYLRDDGTVKVSRSLKERASAVRRCAQELRGSLGREPTLGELGDALALEPEEVAEALNASQSVESLYKTEGEEGLAPEEVLSDSGGEEALLESIALRQAIEQLEPRQQKVLRLRYYHGLTQTQTARLVGVSQVQISRIEKRALERLREIL